MALVTGTQTKYNMIGIREDLSDVIYRISPEDTVFMSGIGKGPKASNTYFEWQTDALAAVDTANAHLEGDEAAFVTPAPTVRVGNQTQISKKTLIISGTAEAVTAAGRKSERALQIAKRGAELKRDMEAILLSNQGADAGSVSVARKTASLAAWVKTNVSMGATGANPSYVSGMPGARTDGTQRVFTETLLKTVIQACWTSGNVPKVLLVGPVNKARVSAFAGIATRTINADAKAQSHIIGAADVYVSDFGNIRVLPSRFQRERDAWLVDYEYASVSYLRPFRTEKLAKTGDAEKEQMLVEYGLRVNQEAALGLVADLTVA
jgi:hypothetical protein